MLVTVTIISIHTNSRPPVTHTWPPVTHTWPNNRSQLPLVPMPYTGPPHTKLYPPITPPCTCLLSPRAAYMASTPSPPLHLLAWSPCRTRCLRPAAPSPPGQSQSRYLTSPWRPGAPVPRCPGAPAGSRTRHASHGPLGRAAGARWPARTWDEAACVGAGGWGGGSGSR